MRGCEEKSDLNDCGREAGVCHKMEIWGFVGDID